MASPTPVGVLLAAVATGSLLAASAAAAPPAGRTTTTHAIAGCAGQSGFKTLCLAGGEDHLVREDGIAEAVAGRQQRRRSLIYFGQLTDFQLADEESPARVEMLDPAANPPVPGVVSAAWRPQEALAPQMVDSSIRQMNRFVRSPLKQGDGRRAKMKMAITTGDSADSQQLNETRWVMRLLEGGSLDPNSGTSDVAGCPVQVDPDEARRYTGVQDYDDYAESPHFYDPDVPLGPYAQWPRYPGLMDRAQLPFKAAGLKVPSYVAFGNHDGLVQGNAAANASFEQVATGCLKPLVPTSDPREALTTLDGQYLLGLLGSDPSKLMAVPPDPVRQFVSKPQYKQVHAAGKQDDAHGFDFVDAAEQAASRDAAGYYSWSPQAGVRFIAIDTVSDAGIAGPSAEGNIDDPQFRWLESELTDASARDELIVLFGHHPVSSLISDLPDEVAPACTAADAHGHDTNPGCDLDPRPSAPIHLGEDMVPGDPRESLVELLQQYPHAIAYVAGHTHQNRVTAYPRSGGGFWEIETAAEADWPQQNRLIELMDNRDGSLSIFGTILDHQAPVAVPSPGTSASSFSPSRLASISRALSLNDPQAGEGTGSGAAQDRNVELLVPDPR